MVKIEPLKEVDRKEMQVDNTFLEIEVAAPHIDDDDGDDDDKEICG